MYPENAYYEFYPSEIVDKILLENPGVSVEENNRLMQEEWDRVKPKDPSMAELADFFGL